MNTIIQEKIVHVMHIFSSAFINVNEELILNKKWNVYFRLQDIASSEEFDYKLLSYLSFYTASHHFKKSSAQCKWAWKSLNRWFKTEFMYDDLR